MSNRLQGLLALIISVVLILLPFIVPDIGEWYVFIFVSSMLSTVLLTIKVHRDYRLTILKTLNNWYYNKEN